MLVIQQINVLPKGARIDIYDGDRLEISIVKAESDGSLIFGKPQDALKYEKIFSVFRVAELKAISYFDGVMKYCIQVRGE